MSETKRRRLGAYPRETGVVCVAGREKSLFELCKALGKRLPPETESCLIYSGGYCLSLRIGTRVLREVLPELCEHSDAVCIGKGYPELFCEHGSVIIRGNALSELRSCAPIRQSVLREDS